MVAKKTLKRLYKYINNTSLFSLSPANNISKEETKMMGMEIFKIGFRKYIIHMEATDDETTNLLNKLNNKFPKIEFFVVNNKDK